jgi:hypothetical protein
MRVTFLWRVLVEEYSLADLVEITGAKPRSLQVWAERGVIIPIKNTAGAGTGVHRLFSRTEAIIACIIHPFSMRQMAVGELLNLSAAIRHHYSKRPSAYEVTGSGGDTWIAVEAWYENTKEANAKHLLSVFTGKEPPFRHAKEPGAIRMTIRLETYLSKLK